MSSCGELLAVIDEADIRNQGLGVTPERMANGVPHVDALAVADAVVGLKGCWSMRRKDGVALADMVAAPDASASKAGQAAVAAALARLCVVGEGEGAAVRHIAGMAWCAKVPVVASVPNGKPSARIPQVRGGNGKAGWSS